MNEPSFKQCPFCQEQIRKEALKCRFCGEWLEQPTYPATSQPVTQEPRETLTPAPMVQTPIKAEVSTPTHTQLASTVNAPVNEKIVSELLDKDPPAKTQSKPMTSTESDSVTLSEDANHSPINTIEQPRWPILPLILALFWVFWSALPRAIEVGVTSYKYLLLNTLVYCTTPGSILVFVLLGFWFVRSHRSYQKSKGSEVINKKRAFDLIYAVWVGVGILVLGAIAFQKSYSAWEQRVATEKQEMQAKGINPDALKGWEFTKTKDPKIGDSKTGLSPESKKRMRENFALQYRGELASIDGVTVDLEGESHDRLTFAFKAKLTKDSTKAFVDGIRQSDPDFGNRLRFLEFSGLVLSGTNYSESFSKTDFLKWSQNYDVFVSNTIAMYDTTGSTNSFFSNKNEINPETQKLLRVRLADGMNGALKSIHKSFEVKLMGTNDDVLCFSCKDASEKDMTDLLKSFQEDKDGYFFDGLKAMGISELVLEGGTYRRSIPRREFTTWCRNYEKYMAELQKKVGQMSDAMKHDATAP